MIIREGSNVKYTHDEEALIAELLTWREFSDVSAERMLEYLTPLRQYTYNRGYWYDTQYKQVLRPSNEFLYMRAEIKAFIIEVQLWKVQETARAIIEAHGFSCVVCGAHTKFEKIGRFYNENVRYMVRDRQQTWYVTLACEDCALDLSVLFSNNFLSRFSKGISDRLIKRLTVRTGER